MSESVPSPEELTALCREWQQRLRLQDWRIRCRYSEPFELEGNQADICPTNATKSALLRINCHQLREDADCSRAPIEVRLIHELVHLHWEMVWPVCERNSPQWLLAEQAVDSIAWALYRAKYGDKAVDEFLA